MKGVAHPFHVTVIRYTDARGNRCSKNTPGAKRVKSLTDTYYANIPQTDGSYQRQSLKTRDERQAWLTLNALLKRAAEQKAGIRDAFIDAAERPLTEHIEEWCAAVLAKGTSAEQVDLLKAHVEALAEAAGWTLITQLDEASAHRALAALKVSRNLSAQTYNHYLTHVKQFARWLTRKAKRLRSDPLAELEKIGVEDDRRHDRRSPTDAEVKKLFEHLASPRARTRAGMSGPQRALGYRLCMATGFRASELRLLKLRSFNLDGAEVTGSAAYSKNKKKARQPLPGWLVEELRAWFAADNALWEAFPEDHPGRLLKADLRLAGVPYEIVGPDGFPLFFDFHSLRHWYITQLANQPGISPKALMELARHSDPRLTLKVYAHAEEASRTAAAAQIPNPGAAKTGDGGASKPTAPGELPEVKS